MKTNIAPKLLNKILDTKPAKYLTKPNVAGAAATIALISTTSKDLVATYYYVTQSLKNEKIPEEKRKFVAALDLSNGILNLIFGITFGKLIEKGAGTYFKNSIEPEYFSKEAVGKMYEKIGKNVDYETFKGRFLRNSGYAKTGLAVIATLVGSQILSKRILVPFLATPMASYFKNKMEKKTGEKNTPELEKIISTQMPTIGDFKTSMAQNSK